MSESLRMLWPYLLRRRRSFALGFSALVLKNILTATLPVFIGRGVDSIRATDEDRVSHERRRDPSPMGAH